MTKTLHRDPARRCMPIAEWPEADRRLWNAAQEPIDLLDGGGSRAAYAQVSNRKIVVGYGRFLSWLAYNKLLDPNAAPADRITRDRVIHYVEELQTVNASQTMLARLRELFEAAQVMDPDRDWAWIRRIASKVRATHRPARNKRARMVGADDLWALGQNLMTDSTKGRTDRQRAIMYRDGLIIALLALRPLRRRNLAGLVLHDTVVQRGGYWWIQISPEDTKTHEAIEEPWPEALASGLETYLAIHRPMLCRLTGRWARPVGDALWVSSNGSPMTEQALYDRIVERTRAAFGRSVWPHLFRDCAATSFAIQDPAHVGIASKILGHRSRQSAEKYYIQAGSIEAARRYQAFMLELLENPRGLAHDQGEGNS